MKLWQKNIHVNKAVEDFTIGKDRELDLLLAEYDVLGSLAHAKMLFTCSLLTKNDYTRIKKQLILIHKQILSGKFKIQNGVEDVHSQVEFMLTKKIGEAGKKIHTGRSRNDQVMLDVILFSRNGIHEISELVFELHKTLISLSNKYRKDLLPGYTHLQIAMPSAFGLWFGAYAESLKDDMTNLGAAHSYINKNPLGSAAGYGTSLPIKRSITAKLLAFDGLVNSSVYAQIKRGKAEKVVANALAGVGATLAKLSMDICLYMNQQFGFISFPENLTTGSSIMPHKKNPDVFELIRGKCNRLQLVPLEIESLIGNLPSGYHREFQELKDIYLGSFGELKNCLMMMNFMLKKIKVKKNILDDSKYDSLFTVESVNALVKKGISFREAYKQVGAEVESGSYKRPSGTKYTHEGSLGNINNKVIVKEMAVLMKTQRAKKVKEEGAYRGLLN